MADATAMAVTLKADFRDFDRALLRSKNETDAKLAAIERKFSKTQAAIKQQSTGLAAAAKGGLSQLQTTVANAGAGIPGLSGGVGSLGVAGAAAAVGIGALVVALRGVKDAGKFAADLVDAADRIGVGVEALQALRYAADETGVPLDKLDSSLEALNGTLGAFKTNIGAGKIKPVFEALGITQADLANIDDANAFLPILADRLSKVSSRAEQVQLARKLGVESLLPMLRQGADGIGRMATEAQDLGLVLSSDVVSGLDATDRALEKTQQQIDANVRSMEANLAPFFLWVTDGFAKLTRGVGDFINALGRAEDRNGRVLASQSASLQRQVTSAYQRAPNQPGGRLTAVQERWVRDLAAVNAEIGRRTRASIATNAPSAAERVRETAEPPAHESSARTGRSGGAGSGNAARAEESAAREASQRQRRFEDDLANANTALLRAQGERAVSAEQRAAAAREELRIDVDARKIQLDRMEADGEITAANRLVLEEADRAVRIAKDRNIQIDLDRQVTEGLVDADKQMRDFTIGLLQIRSSQARTADERRRIELELLAIHQQERRLALERMASDVALTDAQRAAARSQLAGLSEMESAERTGVVQATGGPLDAWRDQSLKTTAQVREAMEGIAARGLDRLNEGLADVITGTRKMGDVFRDVASQVVAELARIAVRRSIIGPLANLLFPGSGSPFTSSAGSGLSILPDLGKRLADLPGYAGGGSFSVGVST